MRILITGSREWPRPEVVHGHIEMAVAEHCRDSSVTIIHGAARGVDTFAHQWCETHPMYGAVFVVEEIHRAAWKSPERKAAGIWRNRRMVDAGADLCLAFICQGSAGATHCADYAEKAGITVRRLLA